MVALGKYWFNWNTFVKCIQLLLERLRDHFQIPLQNIMWHFKMSYFTDERFKDHKTKCTKTRLCWFRLILKVFVLKFLQTQSTREWEKDRRICLCRWHGDNANWSAKLHTLRNHCHTSWWNAVRGESRSRNSYKKYFNKRIWQRGVE